MSGIAFYAPMKPPDDPVPSGDRTMARALMAALGAEARLISRFRSRDRDGNAIAQDQLFAEADQEIERLAQTEPPDLWLTYHSYYKTPDLIGSALSKRWQIPYVLVEATRAAKRLTGPYARFAAAAEKACDAADLIFYLTEQDGEALHRDRVGGQALVHLRPFLAADRVPPYSPRKQEGMLRLVTCGMFRPGDKLASYNALAAALDVVLFRNWSLTIIGDGPKRARVEGMFQPFGSKVTFAGALPQGEMASHFREADLFVWPGIGEAFGMVYLEAQAEGCPVLAEDRPGVRDVVRDGGWLATAGDPLAFAGIIDRLAGDPASLAEAGVRARERIKADHLMGAARATLSAALAPLLVGR